MAKFIFHDSWIGFYRLPMSFFIHLSVQLGLIYWLCILRPSFSSPWISLLPCPHRNKKPSCLGTCLLLYLTLCCSIVTLDSHTSTSAHWNWASGSEEIHPKWSITVYHFNIFCQMVAEHLLHSIYRSVGKISSFFITAYNSFSSFARLY